MNNMLSNIKGHIEPKGWILEYLRRDRDGITGYLDKLCPDAKSRIFMDKKVKHEIKDYWSSWWLGETEGNWIIAFIELAVALKEKELLKKASDWVYECLKYQDDDGYMGIYQPGERYGNGARNGDLWTQSRLMNAMLSLYEYNKDDTIINGLVRLADLTVKQYSPNRSFYEIPDEDGSKTHGLMIIEPLLVLYSKFGKKEYLDFCEWLYMDYSKYDSKFPTSDIAINNAIDPEIPFIGHGPHTCEQLRIPLLLFSHTKDPLYRAVYRAAAEKISNVSTLSGSCKSDELIGVFKSYIPEDERTGLNIGGCVPIPGIGYEYCSTTELLYSYTSGAKILEDSKYADKAEWLVHNAAMAARRHDGKAIQYLCADNSWNATRKKGERWDFSPTHSDAAVCCAPNAGKLMPAFLSNMWQQESEGGLYAMYYGPCLLKTDDVEILQETNYPFENTIRFTVKTLENISINFRIPGWSKGYSMTVNGKPSMQREFKNGDYIVLEFAAAAEFKQAADGSFALAHGPLLYALDIPSDADNYYAYDIKGFYDTDYLPKPGAKWDYTFLKGQDIKLKEKPQEGFPWDYPCIQLETVMLSDWAVPEIVKFVPVGCTILKRTAFPKTV